VKRLIGWTEQVVDDGVAAIGCADLRDRIRNVVWAALAVMAIFAIAAVEGLRVGVPLFAVVAVLAIGATGAALVIVRRTGRHDIAAHVAMGILFAIMLVRITLLGGWSDPLVGVLYTFPVGAAVLISIRAAIVWGAISLAGLFGFWILHAAGVEPSSVLPAGETAHGLFNRVSIHVVILAMVGIFMISQRSTESRLRESNRRLELEAAHVEMLRIAAIAANESATVREAIERWLGEVSVLMGWPLAHAHELIENPGRPVSYLDPNFAANRARLAVMGARFAADVAIPASDYAVWFDGELGRSENPYRKALADELGLRSRIAAVMDIGDRPWLVEMFSERALEPDDGLADVLANTGTQLSRVLERERTQSRIHDLAYYDPLTGLPNRRHFREQLAERAGGKDLVLLLVGLDRFKSINEGLGHGAGDAVLREISDRLIGAIRSDTDIGTGDAAQVFRLGGDEFALLLDVLDPAASAGVAQRILDRISRPIQDGTVELFATASIGIAVAGLDGEDASSLLSSADAALTGAKRAGGNRFSFFSAEMNAANKRRLVLENQLRRAVGRGELAVMYQPLIDAASGDVVAVEALVRWTNAAGEAVSPAEFIPIAEATGQIELIGAWVLRAACSQLAAWRRDGVSLRMSVNVSIDQLRDPSFVEMVRGVMSANELGSGDLELEITESRLIQNASSIVKTLEKLRRSGVGLALDDFGTGYSSLSQIRELPIDRLKIDQSFVTDITSNSGDSALVDAVLGIARDLNLGVVAEGVETEAQRDLLCQRGCHELQGYLFARPLEPDAVAAMCGDRPSATRRHGRPQTAQITPVL
jgi:diguanylate cyclase (GGDEF)-like protein